MATKQGIVDLAEEIVKSRRAGVTKPTVNGFTFDTTEGGWCARFVLQVYECAMGLPEGTWKYRPPESNPSARAMEREMRADGLQTSAPQPGDIIGLNNQNYWAGHIAIYLGKVNGVESIAENTSEYRGDPNAPGTKITPLSDVVHELTAYYSVLPAAQEAAPYHPGPITVQFGDKHVDGWMTPDHGIVGVRALAELLGFEVQDDIPAHRAVIIKPKGD